MQDIVWMMKDRIRGEKRIYYPQPFCVSKIEDNKIEFTNGCIMGGNYLVGSLIFETKEECINHFLKTHDSFEEEIPQEEIPFERRTDWDNHIVVKFDTIEQTSVYLNSFSKLVNISDELPWHTEYVDALYMEVGSLTLHEISEYVKEKYGKNRLITVFQEDMLRSQIFQWGNYKDVEWVHLGEIMGYA